MLQNIILLSKEEQTDLLNKVEQDDTFKKLKEAMEQQYPTSTQGLQVIEAIKGEVVWDDGKAQFKSIVLFNKEKHAKLYILESQKDNNVFMYYSADVSDPENTEVLGLRTGNGEVKQLFGTEFDPTFFKETNYAVQLMNRENDVEAEDFPFSFCLVECAGTYRHCGPGCGDGMSKGGGTPINAIDSCCRAHDRCYANFGWGDDCCDKELVDCVTRNKSVDYCAYIDIVAWFGGDADNC
ncbi:hypothetical protein HPJ93_14680 [Anoxybacillus flavithermus]|uniref:hypothetical protein n=1 Tax=Anoxybacillus flavithermus TaxID=33934 RepID=UPI00186963DE|nr:hypothetical protein [Anoxybacillus flavithermus]MBE2922894.1 hypothetical protein [Anoxybacillus flavithermus]